MTDGGTTESMAQPAAKRNGRRKPLLLLKDLALGALWIGALNVIFMLPLALGHETVLPALTHDPLSALAVSIACLALLAAVVVIHLPGRRRAARLRLRPLWPVAHWLGAAVLALWLLDAAGVVLYQQVLQVPRDAYEWLYAFAEGPYGWLPLTIAVVGVGPFIEELVFRGWIQRRLERALRPSAAIGLTALLFALVHMIPLLVPYYLLMGLVFGYAAYVSRSLWAPVVLHMAMNAYTLAFVYLGPPPEVFETWSPGAGVLSLLAVAAAALTIILVLLLNRLRPRPPA